MAPIGPYFSVKTYDGKVSYFTNGSYQWKTAETPFSVSYLPPTITTYTITPQFNIGANEAVGFIGPVFSNLRMNDIYDYLNGYNTNILYLLDSKDNHLYGWIGENSEFFGGLIPDKTYKIKVKPYKQNASFSVNITSYMVITNYLGKNNATGSIVWSTSNYLTDGDGATINTFYHLNKIRDFMMKFNRLCTGIGCIDLNKHVPVMINLHNMANAFYDLDNDAIFFGVYENKNFALDGTVIRHEYGHLIMNRIYPIIYLGEFGAITEAISDYFSISSFWDEGESITTLGNYIGVGEGTIRDLKNLSDNPRRIPDNWVGEVHNDGQILSGALYKIRKSTNGTGCNVDTGANCTYTL